MKTFTLSLTTFLFIAFLITANTSKAQTHRLLSKIEETNRGWDKVTVMLPNNSYELSKVSYENNTVLILFDYTKTKDDYKTNYFTFNLSDYKINCKQISEQASFLVIAKSKKNTLTYTKDNLLEYVNDKNGGAKISTFRCPVYCPF